MGKENGKLLYHGGATERLLEGSIPGFLANKLYPKPEALNPLEVSHKSYHFQPSILRSKDDIAEGVPVDARCLLKAQVIILTIIIQACEPETTLDPKL